MVSNQKFSDVKFGADFETIAQLRTGSPPNSWESAWAVFDYTDNTHFYYVAFKPNGWEIGKADPAYPGAQKFLASGSDVKFEIGTQHHFDIVQNGNTFSVSVDGKALATVTDTERPYLSGSVGFYTEDAKVVFDNVIGSITDRFDGIAPQSFIDGATVGQWHIPFLGFGRGEIGPLTGTQAPVAPKAELIGTEKADYIVGTSQDDTIKGLGGNDNLNGLAGNDTITGGDGADKLSGGFGNDTFVFNKASESVRGAADTIVDWNKGDHIDLRGIDAIAGTPGMDHFVFIDGNALTKPGQATYGYDAKQDITYVDARVDSNPAHDLHIELTGHHTLTASDFLF